MNDIKWNEIAEGCPCHKPGGIASGPLPHCRATRYACKRNACPFVWLFSQPMEFCFPERDTNPRSLFEALRSVFKKDKGIDE